MIAAIGHAAQIVGALFSLVTPDRSDEEKLDQ
jgi:hypothetical protein